MYRKKKWCHYGSVVARTKASLLLADASHLSVNGAHYIIKLMAVQAKTTIWMFSLRKIALYKFSCSNKIPNESKLFECCSFCIWMVLWFLVKCIWCSFLFIVFSFIQFIPLHCIAFYLLGKCFLVVYIAYVSVFLYVKCICFVE